MKNRMLVGQKIAILTEGGKNIGVGHIVRCLALYQAFEANGARPELIINGDKTVERFLEQKRYRLINWLKYSELLFSVLAGFDRVVIDSYLAPAALYRKIAGKISGQLVVIDDLNRRTYPGGLVINPSIYGDRIKYPRNKAITYLLGKEYIILRQPFWNVPARKLRKNVKDVMIALGGSDQAAFLEKLLKFLSVNYRSFRYHLVAPKFRAASDHGLKLSVYHDLSAREMLRLMRKCDLAVSAGGQTSYELARTGTPAVAVCLADNQAVGLEFFSRLGMIESAGGIGSKKLWAKLAGSLNKLLRYEARAKMQLSGANVIDGKGAQRIIEKVVKCEN
jgi:UDP-2,4-diacetamido-2,4,6-trideoxy-beta-L-altropyranose hydrolase